MIAGCSTCQHAVMRFNGGHGATTCNALSGRIVATGNRHPEKRPVNCPLELDSEPANAYNDGTMSDTKQSSE